MGIKWYCDICKKLIGEEGNPKKNDVNRPFVISRYNEGKSTDHPNIGWSGPENEVEFWACTKCKDEFMNKVQKIFEDMKGKKT